MTFAPAFTCLIPVWEGDDPAQFAEAIESLSASTLRPDATIICQDGALPASLTDRVAIARTRLNARVVVNPGPRGLSHNLNHALAEVETPYAARLDADDINLPQRFALQSAFAATHPEIAAFGGAIAEFDPSGRSRVKVLPTEHAAMLRFARWRNPINHMTAFFRVQAVRDAGGYPHVQGKEDYGLWLTLLARGEGLGNLAEVLVRARLGANFHKRRAGLGNLATEWALYDLKRRSALLRGPSAAAALALRGGALAFPGAARWIYDGILRR